MSSINTILKLTECGKVRVNKRCPPPDCFPATDSQVTLTGVEGDNIVSLVNNGEGPDLSIFSLAEGDNITLAEADGVITISAAGDGGTTATLTPGTGGFSLISDPTGPSLGLYNLIPGDNVTITEDTINNTLTINADVPEAVITTLASLGGDLSLVTDDTGPTLQLRGVRSGTNINLSTDVDGSLVIASTVNLGDVVLSSTPGDINLVTDSSGPSLQIRGVTAGDGISLTTDVNESLVITATPTNLTSIGGDLSLVYDGDGPVLQARGLSAGQGIEIAQLPDESIRISAIATTLSSTGDPETTQDLVIDGTGPALSIKSLNAGPGIVFTSEANHITIDTAASSAVTLTSAGDVGSQSLVTDSTGPTLQVKGIVGGTGISLANTTLTDIVIDSTLPSGNDVTLTTVGTGQDLVTDGTGPSLQLKSLIAGTNVTFGVTGTDLTINSSTGTTTTLTNAGPGTSLVNDGTGPTLAVKSLTFGTGLEIINAANNIHIDTTGGGTAVTLSNAGVAATNQSLVNDATGPTLATKGIRGDNTSISVASDATDVLVSYIGTDASDVTLSSVGAGQSLVSDSTGPTLATKSIEAGTAITVVDNTDRLTINSTGTNVSLTNAGTGTTQSLVADGTGPGLQTLGLRAGDNISLGVTDNNVVITSSPPDFSTSLVSVRAPADIFMDSDTNIINWGQTYVNGGSFNTTTGVYTIPSTGIYEITSTFSWQCFGSINFDLLSGDPSYYSIRDAALTTYYASSYLPIIDYDNTSAYIFPVASGEVTCSFIRQFTAGDQLVGRYESPTGYGNIRLDILESFFNARRIA